MASRKNVKWDKSKCTHCGLCTSICPTSALNINRQTWKVYFESDKCTACEMCLDACPTQAIAIEF